MTNLTLGGGAFLFDLLLLGTETRRSPALSCATKYSKSQIQAERGEQNILTLGFLGFLFCMQNLQVVHTRVAEANNGDQEATTYIQICSCTVRLL